MEERITVDDGASPPYDIIIDEHRGTVHIVVKEQGSGEFDSYWFDYLPLEAAEEFHTKLGRVVEAMRRERQEGKGLSDGTM